MRDNAAWCALVAGTHGISGATDADAWTSPVRTPPGYPDAVTLRPGVDAARVLSRVDTTSPGCSVKDSHADLDLSTHGFRELFTASWIWRDPAPAPDARPSGAPWVAVTDADALRAWETAWGGGPPRGLVRPALLDDPRVRVLAAWDGPDVVAGGVLTVTDARVVGVSNLFAADGGPAVAWPHVLAWVATHHPGLPLVGYEAGDDLDAALAAGCVTIGPLRVWVADDPARA